MTNFIQIYDSFYIGNHLCIILELLGLNLYQILQRTNYEGFSLQIIKRFAKQLLEGLLQLDQIGVCHCDIKPENIFLLNEQMFTIKIGDFGCSFENSKENPGYIQSRFYRAPEAIIGKKCDNQIDM